MNPFTRLVQLAMTEFFGRPADAIKATVDRPAFDPAQRVQAFQEELAAQSKPAVPRANDYQFRYIVGPSSPPANFPREEGKNQPSVGTGSGEAPGSTFVARCVVVSGGVTTTSDETFLTP